MSCCGGNCNCGDTCKCGGGCKRNPSLGYAETAATASIRTIISGVAPAKMHNMEMPEMGSEEGDGCKCGSSCGCDPCTCK